MSPTAKQGNGHPEPEPPGQLHYRAEFNPGGDEAARRYIVGQLTQALDRLWDIERLGRPFTNITPAAFRIWHTGLFDEVLDSELVGRFREYGEQSTYQLSEVQPGGTTSTSRRFGLRAKKNALTIQRAVKKACGEFQSALPRRITASFTVADAVVAPAKLYIDTLQIRPFAQGNDAVAYLALHAAYHRLGLDAPGFTPRSGSAEGVEFNHCIAAALHSRQPDSQPLLDYLARHSHFA